MSEDREGGKEKKKKEKEKKCSMSSVSSYNNMLPGSI